MQDRPGHATAAAFAVGIALLAPPAAAQGTAPTDPVPVDGVWAIVGDRVIVLSEIDRELRARGPETEAEAVRDRNQIVQRLINEELWVQHGRTLGDRAPEEFAEFLERDVERRIQQEIDNIGSYTAYVRGLEAIGSSMDAARQSYRQELMGLYARQQARTRFRDSALLVTPAEMLRYFRDHPDEFAARCEADIAMVSLPLPPNGDAAVARTRAEEVVRAWRAEPTWTTKELRERFPDVIVVSMDALNPIDPDRSSVSGFVKEFVRRAAAGEVSDPIQPDAGGRLHVLKVLSKIDRPAGRFEDVDTQNRIRDALLEQKLRQLDTRLRAEIRRSIYVWDRTLDNAPRS